jgi:hypothetical protein
VFLVFGNPNTYTMTCRFTKRQGVGPRRSSGNRPRNRTEPGGRREPARTPGPQWGAPPWQPAALGPAELRPAGHSPTGIRGRPSATAGCPAFGPRPPIPVGGRLGPAERRSASGLRLGAPDRPRGGGGAPADEEGGFRRLCARAGARERLRSPKRKRKRKRKPGRRESGSQGNSYRRGRRTRVRTRLQPPHRDSTTPSRKHPPLRQAARALWVRVRLRASARACPCVGFRLRSGPAPLPPRFALHRPSLSLSLPHLKHNPPSAAHRQPARPPAGSLWPGKHVRTRSEPLRRGEPGWGGKSHTRAARAVRDVIRECGKIAAVLLTVRGKCGGRIWFTSDRGIVL